MKDKIILFDIGGTKTRIVLSDGEKFLGEPIIFETPQNFEEGVSKIVEQSRKLLPDNSPTALVGGIAGPLNQDHSQLVSSPNLPLWVNQPIKKVLEEALGAPVRLENDASLAGLGEATHGAGKGERIVAYLTISTGVGGTRVVDSKIDQNIFGFEPGSQIVDPQIVYATDLLSGKALEKKFGKKVREVDEQTVWKDLADKLAIVVNNTIVFWSPDVVVLGGSMVLGNPAIDITEVEESLKKIMRIFPKYSRVKKAELGDLNGLYGALALLQNQ